jgi:hypothetical protein
MNFLCDMLSRLNKKNPNHFWSKQLTLIKVARFVAERNMLGEAHAVRAWN